MRVKLLIKINGLVSQSGAHQAQQFMNLPAATPAYAGYSGLYYNAFQYPPTMFAAAAATAVSATILVNV